MTFDWWSNPCDVGRLAEWLHDEKHWHVKSIWRIFEKPWAYMDQWQEFQESVLSYREKKDEDIPRRTG